MLMVETAAEPIKQDNKPKKDVTATGINAKTNSRFRVMFLFWLDADKDTNTDNQLQLIKDLTYFKSQRKFSKLIRDALRLMFALLLDDVSVLVELFPGVVQGLQAEARSKDSMFTFRKRLNRNFVNIY
jgi:hypothetical protein